MKKKDQILLEEAYQKVLEDYARFGDSDKLQQITPDNVDKITTDRQRDPEWDKRWEQDKNTLKKKWVDIGFNFSDVVSLINKNEQKAKLEFGIYNLRDLKPGDKKSQEFITSLAKKDLQTHYELFKLVDPDKILKGYRSYVDPGLQKQDREQEEARKEKIHTEISEYNGQAQSETIKKLEGAGFKRLTGDEYKEYNTKDGKRFLSKFYGKTIGSLLGRSREELVVRVNPNGSIGEEGMSVDDYLQFGKGKRFAQSKKSFF